MNHTDNQLSKMLPALEKLLSAENPAGPTAAEEAEVEEEELEQEAPAPLPPEMLDEVVSYLRRYLVCDDHQLALLALWGLHTWCYSCFFTTPYLDVRSPLPQSGKSLCLKLLQEISVSPSSARGANERTLMNRLLTWNRSLKHLDVDNGSLIRTLFLDDCHHTFSSSERQPIVALFNSSADALSCYPSGSTDYYLFGPKAFAGDTPLPRSLAGRCIPIVLQRKKPSDVVARFDPSAVRDAGVKLACWMESWVEENIDVLVQATGSAPPQLPLNLTPGEQACVEPLLYLADAVGGPWPQRARAAIAAVFNLPQSCLAVQLLGDIREIFHKRNNPDHLSTRELLAGLIELEYRPWSAWTSKSGQKLAKLLQDFGIASRAFHHGDASTYRGYLLQSFEDAWERYLPPLTVCSATETAFEPGAATVNS